MDVVQLVMLPNGDQWKARVQPLHSTVASSELRDIYILYVLVVKIGFRTQEIGACSVTTYH